MEKINVSIHKKDAEEISLIQDAVLNYHKQHDGFFLMTTRKDFNNKLISCANKMESWHGECVSDGMDTLTMFGLTGVQYYNCIAHVENDKTREWMGLVAGSDDAGHGVLKFVGEIKSEESKKICEEFLNLEVFEKYGYEKPSLNQENGLYVAEGLTPEALSRLTVKGTFSSVNFLTDEEKADIKQYLGEKEGNEDIEKLQQFIASSDKTFNTNGSLKLDDKISFRLREDIIEWIPTKVDGLFIQKFDAVNQDNQKNNNIYLTLITVNAKELGDRIGVNMKPLDDTLADKKVLDNKKEEKREQATRIVDFTFNKKPNTLNHGM